jgi:hypothetical protein
MSGRRATLGLNYSGCMAPAAAVNQTAVNVTWANFQPAGVRT